VRKAKRAAGRRGRRLRILFADEARFGRINRPRPCWAPIGIRPEVASQLIREYIYLYGAVSPKDGTCVYLIMPRSDTACFQVFLNALSRKFARQDILLVLDGAPNHRCRDLVLPGNISLLFLPPYSPELNPKENLWDEIREKIFKNYALKSIDAVRAKLRFLGPEPPEKLRLWKEQLAAYLLSRDSLVFEMRETLAAHECILRPYVSARWH